MGAPTAKFLFASIDNITGRKIHYLRQRIPTPLQVFGTALRDPDVIVDTSP
jgi:hypothetical protein